jgi:hypothetical protein
MKSLRDMDFFVISAVLSLDSCPGFRYYLSLPKGGVKGGKPPVSGAAPLTVSGFVSIIESGYKTIREDMRYDSGS